MLSNYLKIAFRNLWKHKLFSFINIFGLAAGMVICILALVDTSKAYNYDEFHPFPERTFRIVTDMSGRENQHEAYASAPAGIGSDLKKYSFVEGVVRVVPARSVSFTGNEKTLPAPGYFVEPDFLKVFGFKMLRGTLSAEPNTMVLNEEKAKTYFGKTDPIGQSLVHEDWGEFLITGILADPVEKSHLEFDMLTSFSTLAALEKRGLMQDKTTGYTDPWTAYTYVLLKKAATASRLNGVLPTLGKTATAALSADSKYREIRFRSQALGTINPSKEDFYNFPGGTTLGKIMVQLGIGLLTLFLAGFNYVNLTLARSIARTREIGVRKVIGAQRWQVFTQFITESILLAFFALGLALCMLELLKPIPVIREYFIDFQFDVTFAALLFFFSLTAGILAGLIPSRILSRLKPALVLKGKQSTLVFKGIAFRKILVVLQFAISITGIIVMLVIYKQQKFMAEGEYGFNREHILNITLNGKHNENLLQEFKRIPGVEQATPASFTLGVEYPGVQKINRKDAEYFSQTAVMQTDPSFISSLGLKLVAGSDLPPGTGEQAGNMILVNEMTSRALHYSSSAEIVGKMIWLNDSVPLQIAGVVKDFHSMSMFFPIYPLIILHDPSNYSVIHLKTSPGADPKMIQAGAEKIWKNINPYDAFNSQWFDTQLRNRHDHGDDQLLLGLICALVLSIAALGLLGMVTYSSELRIKEVGVRKVMGARVNQLLYLLSKDFMKLLLIAGLIAMPAGWLLGFLFLQNFAFHVSIGVGILVFSVLGLFILGGLMVGLQTWKVAGQNPVSSLRAE